MFYIVIMVLLFVLLYGPSLWVKWVLNRHSKELPDIPGTGGELAVHLVNRFELEGVKVEETGPDQNFYHPGDNMVGLSPRVFQGRSLTAIAVAAHEVGHAIQFNRKEPVTRLRLRYLDKAHVIQRAGTVILMAAPFAFALFHVPHAMIFTALLGIATMLVSVAVYAAILPEEWDASFNKALPILIEGEYVDEQQLKAVRQILKACALTYVAAALADILSLWRWIAILRR
jgi:hypothetical protein